MATSCVDEFKESYELEINSDKYTVKADANSLPIVVYCSGNWTATLTTESEWSALDCGAGNGISTIHLDCEQNVGLSRSVEVVLRSAGLEKRISVLQRSGIASPEFTFAKEELAFANGSYAAGVDLLTNLPEELLQKTEPVVTYPDEVAPWISEVSYLPIPLPEGGDEEPTPGVHAGRVSFKTAPNTSGEERVATVAITVTDAAGVSYGDQFTVKQGVDAGSITLTDDKAPIEGGVREVMFATTLGVPLDELNVEVTYKDPAIIGFISDVTLGAEKVTYTLTENTTITKRFATITVSYTDLAGTLTSASSVVTQRVVSQPREIKIADLRALFGSSDVTYPSDEDHTDYIICRVVGDASNPNMDQNINTGPNSITTDENDRTNYVQSEDGRYGFRLKCVTAADNTLCRYDRVKILLDGLTLSMENNPARYTLRGVKAAHVERLAEGSASDLPVKELAIGALTDDDVYTYRTFTDMEFSVKEGAYTNIREYDAILNPYNTGVTFGNAQVQKAKDGAVNLLYDGGNDAIYLLINMNCRWRRAGQSVPQGVGRVSGIVVHTPMERWGGNVGRYSIRPFDETDIAIERAATSSFTTLAEWKLAKSSVSVHAYQWDGGSYVLGDPKGNSATQLVQNKMLATTNNTGGKSMLYSENRMLCKVATADTQYPIGIVDGYRGLDVSRYTAGMSPAFGMSRYTGLAFYGNVAGWYQWTDDTWNGKTNGIVMEFPTSGVGGSTAAVSFSIAAGRHNTTEVFCSWTSTNSFPVYWKVEYATSTDDGTTWSDYSEATNAATGERGFEMRSIPWCINGSQTLSSIFDTDNKKNIWTHSDFGFGLVPYRFVLPAEVFGKSKVRVRITPSSDVIAAWNIGANNYNLGQTHRGLRMAKTYATHIAGAVYLEDVSVQYK